MDRLNHAVMSLRPKPGGRQIWKRQVQKKLQCRSSDQVVSNEGGGSGSGGGGGVGGGSANPDQQAKYLD